MRKFAVYATLIVVEIAWSALCLYLLACFRTSPVMFFEITLVWLAVSIQSGRWSKRFLHASRAYGRFDSKIEDWDRMQRDLREEERNRRRYLK